MQEILQNKLLLATNNPGKIKEFTELLSPLSSVQLVTPKMIGINIKVAETGSTYFENALIKAHTFSEASGLISIADDSGLEVDALNGAPGLFSSRYGNLKGDAQLSYLLNQLEDIKPKNCTARFVATVVIYSPDDSAFTSHKGICEGTIIKEKIGSNGFGYDPLFFIPSLKKTMAQLDDDTKNLISHRAKAVRAALSELRKHFPAPMV
jgi:XTP/dITP diphosphohydrolase